MTSLPKETESNRSALERRASGSSELKLRAAEAGDGAAIAELVRATRLLEPASGYAYVMMADMFGQTCAVAELDGRTVGCVIAFRPPSAPEALFVWQIGVHPLAQRRGVAHKMLDAILARPACDGVTEVRATVAPSNSPSEEMFRAFARKRGANMERIGGYPAEYFSDPHEPERLFRIAGLRSGAARAPQ